MNRFIPAPGFAQIWERITRSVFGVDLEGLVRSYRDAFPGEGSGGYVKPSVQETANMREVALRILSGAQTEASKLLKQHGYNYRVRSFLDLATGRWVTVLLEHRKDGASYPWPKRSPADARPWRHGWGLYVFAVDSASRTVVQVPHPLADQHTEIMGVAAFRRGARVLMIAGAHRYANEPEGAAATAEDVKAKSPADVARYPGSVFEAVHQGVAAQLRSNADPEGAGRPRIVQIHGFVEAPECGEVFVSDGVQKNGQGVPAATRIARNVRDRLRQVGYGARLYDRSGVCDKLAATGNVQGASLRAMSLTDSFVHVEVTSELRLDKPDKALDVARRATDAAAE